jgi:hypothetical protein
MGRPRCDPIDVAGVLDALASGRVTPFHAYREYAATAARPYARSSWEVWFGVLSARLGERRAAEHEREASAQPDLPPDARSFETCPGCLSSRASWS